MNLKTLLPWMCAALLLAPVPAFSGATPWEEGAHSRARLITAGNAGAHGIELGVQIELQPGWETYWRSPGDAGLPPAFDWTSSENATGFAVRWPLPERIERYGMVTWGYLEEVVFPVTVETPDPALPSRVRLRLTYAACAEVCVLNDAEFVLDVEAAPRGGDVALGALIARHGARVPERDTAWLAVNEFRIVETGGWAVEITVTSDRPLSAPEAIVEDPQGFALTTFLFRLEDDGRRAAFRSAVVPAFPGTDAEGPFTLTLFDRTLAAEADLRSPVLPR